MPKARNDCYQLQETAEVILFFQTATVIVERRGVHILPLIGVQLLIHGWLVIRLGS